MATDLSVDEIRAERENFEERAFSQYFMSTIKRNPNVPQPRIAGCLDFIATADKTKAEFCAMNEDGRYITEGLDSAWWAWLKRAEQMDVRKYRVLRTIGVCDGITHLRITDELDADMERALKERKS